jgi:gluconolactonase
MKLWRLCLAALLAAAGVYAQAAAEFPAVPDGTPLAVIDLASAAGAAQANAQWRYRDARIQEVQFRSAGPDRQPTGHPVTTHELVPQAGARDFDDSAWDVIAPDSLEQRRGNGRLSFNWYRVRVTIPERVGNFATDGALVVFETAVDDYAEVWVDGELPRAAGQSGGSVVKGWNAANRIVIGRHVQPGQQIQLAVFGANGPLSHAPTNYIYLRYARLEFYPGDAQPHALPPHEVNVEVIRHDPALDLIVPPNPKVFKLAEGFQFTEGPVWVPADGGYLLFSDPNANRIYRYRDGALSVFRESSGYSGADIAEYRQPGSNGLALDAAGRLVIDQHGNRRVIRIEADGSETVLAERYDGKRFNSPNDLVLRSDGSLYVTDPDFGLPQFDRDPRKELPYTGIYRVADGRVTLLSSELKGPNGIAFSPDEKYLYVGNWDPARKVVMRYPVRADGSLEQGSVFFDMTAVPGEDAIDGIKVDVAGNLYVSGPGGLWVLSPQGKHLGTIRTGRHPHNMAWGDDGKTLYLAAQDGLYRMALQIAGVRPSFVPGQRGSRP